MTEPGPAAHRAPVTPTGIGGLREIVRVVERISGTGHRQVAALAGLSFTLALIEATLLYLIARSGLATQAGQSVIAVDVPGGRLDLTVLSALAVAGLLLLVAGALAVVTAKRISRLSIHTLNGLQSRLLESYLSAPWPRQSALGEGRLAELSGDYCLRCERLVQQVSTMIVAACALLVLGLAAVIIAPVAAVFAVCGLALASVGLRPITRMLKRSAFEHAEASKQVVAKVAQVARVTQVIDSFDVSDEVRSTLQDDLDESAGRLGRVRVFSRLSTDLFLYAALFLIIMAVALVATLDNSRLDALAPLLLLLMRGAAYGKQLQTATHAVHELRPYTDALDLAISDLNTHERAIVDGGEPAVGAVDLTNVSYRYSPLGPLVLDDLDLTIRAGEAVGIVGASGAGKSTLIELLLRLRTPTDGLITVGGVPIELVERASWADFIALVPQRNELVRGSMLDNVRFFRPDVDRKDVLWAIEAAHLSAEVAALPEGIDTMIGPGSRDLSGGQLQRLGIARAILRRPQLLVLDEPTSALDRRSELAISGALESLKGSTSMLIVAHRSSTLQVCDRVLALEAGRLTEVTHSGEPVPSAGGAHR